jgi:hypothetical protein
MSVDDARAALDALEVGSTESILRANEIVAAGVAHYWPGPDDHDEAIGCRFVEQPDLWLRQRWLAWSGADETELARIRRRERVDWRTALKIGVGYCSQQAMVLVGYLRERGVEARVMGIDGHVVAVVDTPDGEWVLDPDYGVAIPMTLREIAASPQVVREIYGDAGYPEARLVQLTGIYARDKASEYGGRKIGQLTPTAEAARQAALWGGIGLAVVGVRLRRASRNADGTDGVASGHRDPA